MSGRYRTPAILAVGLILGLASGAAYAQETVLLAETLRPGMQFGIKARVQILAGTLQPPAEKGKAAPAPVRITGDGAMEYQERVLGLANDRLVNKTLRLCQRMEVKRTLGGQPQENILRPAVRRLVILRDKQVKAPFSPDGPLLWSEIDLLRTDIFTPLLVGLLPGRNVTVGDRWQADPQAIQELTGLERIEEGSLDCLLAGVSRRENHRIARVSFKGSVRGANEDGPTRHDVQGHYEFDVDAGLLTFLTLNGNQTLLDSNGQERGRIEGRYALQREALRDVAGLSDAALAALALEPNDDNTRLLFENREMGLKFLYPRRWRLAAVRAAQIQMDTPGGHGLLITLEPTARVPTGAAYLKESREWVEKQRGTIRDTVQPRVISTVPSLEFFSLEADLGGQGRRLDYYIARQAGGGVLLAASLRSQDGEAIRLEVKKIAESATLLRRID